MSSEDIQNNYSSLFELYQSVAAAESISVSVESSDRVPIECSEPPPQEMAHAPQEMAQPPTGLITEEVPSRASNRTVLHLGQSIRDDNMLHQFAERLTTYSCWPSQIPQHREDMALAGFYYTGCGDRVRCAFCNLQLQEWNIDVEPFSRHTHENPRCPFIEKPTCCMNMTSLIDEEVVEEVLACGFQWNDVEVAVARLLSCRCTDEITALEILKYLFQNEKENEIQHVPKKERCMVCHLEDPNILFLPCCHICCCQSCGESSYLCSYCQGRIKAKKRIYIP